MTTNQYPPLANKSGLNGGKLNCPVTDLTTKELIELCVAAMAASPDGPIKDAITACIEAGITEGGAILAAVKACIAAETDANTTTEIIAGPLPASATPPAVPTDDPEDTHIQYYADGIRTWVSDGAGGWALQGDSPYPASCCPAPSIGNVPPAPDAPPPVTAPNGSTPNPVVTGDPATGAATHVSYWVDGSWWTCECGGEKTTNYVNAPSGVAAAPAGPSTVQLGVAGGGTIPFCEGAIGAIYDKPVSPYPPNPTGRLAQEHGGRDGKNEVWLQAPEHYSAHIYGESATGPVYFNPAAAGVVEQRLLEYQMTLTNLSDCRDATVEINHVSHSFAAYYEPGDEGFYVSGDRIFIGAMGGFQGSWSRRNVAWQYKNDTNVRNAFEAGGAGYVGCTTIGPGVPITVDAFSLSATSNAYPTYVATSVPGHTSLEQSSGIMHLTTQ